ncbi:MAG: MerR family transcriptional regulator, partial [Butyrivibrio sp.]|nr:MerR family transcriptional regulator [Butyrivibrio sp.]
MFTAGELAKKLGISARTVRFYDEKGILCPVNYSETGYRIYDESSVEKLQKILMLRFLDFSLEQIGNMIEAGNLDVRESLREQEKKKETRPDLYRT